MSSAAAGPRPHPAWPLTLAGLGALALAIPDARARAIALDLVFFPVLALLAQVCWRRGQRYAEERRGWRWIALGLALMGLLMMVRRTSVLLLGWSYPSAVLQLILIGRIASYASIVVGLLAMPVAPRRGADRLRTGLEALAFALAILCVMWLAGVAEPARVAAMDVGARVRIVAMFLVHATAMGVIVYLASPRPGRYFSVLGVLLAGFAVSCITYVASLAGLDDAYGPLPAARATTLLAGLALSWGLSRCGPIDGELRSPRLERFAGLLPLLPVLGLLVLLFYRHATGGLAAHAPLLWLIYPLVAIILVRQLLTVDAVRRLSSSLEGQVEERSHALASAHEQLQQRRRLEALGRLAGGVAHDFNNLLAGVAGYEHLMARRVVPGSASATHVQEIRRAVECGAGLTRQILTFARRQPGEPQRVVPAQLVKDMEHLLASIVRDDIQLELDEGDDGVVLMDPAQLEQVVLHLATNARDAMPLGGTVRIRVGTRLVVDDEASAPGRYVTIEVEDTGCGMTPEVQAHLFEPFFTTRTGAHAGLGLATSYGIVRQAGGFLTVDSGPGRGSRFVVHVPALDAGAPAAATAPEPPLAAGAGRCILLVDDSPAVRASVAATLRESHFSVLVAKSGEEAVELARGVEERIDVLVTDIMMPGITGVATARAIAKLRPEIRTILISGFCELPETGLPSDLSYLAKPFTPAELIRRIRLVLGPAAGATAG